MNPNSADSPAVASASDASLSAARRPSLRRRGGGAAPPATAAVSSPPQTPKVRPNPQSGFPPDGAHRADNARESDAERGTRRRRRPWWWEMRQRRRRRRSASQTNRAPSTPSSRGGMLCMSQFVRCVGRDGVTFVRTLRDLLLTREAAPTEADTPCMRPALAPLYVQKAPNTTNASNTAASTVSASHDGHPMGGNGAISTDPMGCVHGGTRNGRALATSPRITFTLDGVTTPKTFAAIKEQHPTCEMDVSALPLAAAVVGGGGLISTGGVYDLNGHNANGVQHGSAETEKTPFTTSSPRHSLHVRELPHQYLLRSFSPISGFDFYHSAEGKSLFLALCKDIISRTHTLLESEPLFPRLVAPTFVFGDIHGNFADLAFFLRSVLTFQDLQLTPANIMCLGDYVDRGPHSLECLMALLSLKLSHPSKVVLLRGNHEDRVVCGDVLTYGSSCFLAQCESLLGADAGRSLFAAATSLFRHFPLAAELIVPSVPHRIGPNGRRATHEERVLCTHGGIPRFFAPPREDDSLAFLRQESFPRLLTLFPNNPAVREDPEAQNEIFLRAANALGERDAAAQEGRLRKAWYIAFDLMWSDPTSADPGDEEESGKGGEALNEWGFGVNTRGSNVLTFSAKAVDTFLQAHQYSMLFRAHQEKAHGLRLSKSSKVLTIFSSSNYLGHGNGAGCVVVAANGEIQLVEKLSD